MFKKLFSTKKSTIVSESEASFTGGLLSNGKLSNEQLSNEHLPSEQNIIGQIFDALSCYQSSVLPQGITQAVFTLDIGKGSNGYFVTLIAPFPCRSEVNSLILAISDKLSIKINLTLSLAIKPVRQHQIKHITNIIAVASGKGGVGKSTTAVNLAYALIEEGATVGILDADIYGPSIPTLLGLKNEKPSSEDGKTMTPLCANKLSAMSIGFLVPDEDATVWRGPMASGAFNQLLTETAWPELDYLLIDMPPGTGDIQLTLAQKVPVAAAVIITTPQDIALIDAVKGIAMFDKVAVPVLGIIENMSYHLCENCGHQSYLFGQEGGDNIAKTHQTQLLGQLPLDIRIRKDADQGISPIIENSTSDISQMYRKIAQNMASELFYQLDVSSPNNAEVNYSTE